MLDESGLVPAAALPLSKPNWVWGSPGLAVFPKV
jgi:hypothetical protein